MCRRATGSRSTPAPTSTRSESEKARLRTTPIVPARVELDADGTPFAPAFDDRYHPHGSALAQARHVFLAGCGLPERWRGRDRFVVLETGFGLGNNALATWLGWRDDPARSRRLHVVSIDAHPPDASTLASVPRDGPLRPLAGQLVAAWPPLVPGLHRLAFDDDRFELLLAFGDVADWLPQLTARVDAFFLDGFEPAKNAAMWEPRLFAAMARLAAPGATVATRSATHAVRAGLMAAGFEVRAAPDHEGNREITIGHYAPRHAPRDLARASGAAPAGARVAIVGAGLAGSATASALARRHGIASTVHEAAPDVAEGASNGVAGVFHGVVHRDDGRHARWHRAAALAARHAAVDLVAAHGAAAGAAGGLLRLGRGDGELASMQATARALSLPGGYARVVDAREASEIAGTRIDAPAWWFAGGGWLNPSLLVRHRFDGTTREGGLRCGSRVASLRRDGDRWLLLDASARVLDEADVVVCANAASAAALLGASGWPLARLRGQADAIALSGDDRAAAARPRVPLAGDGYAVASDARTLWFGATSHADDDQALARDSDRAANWRRVGALLPSLANHDPVFVDSRIGERCACSDRLPIVGAVPDERLAPPRPEQPRHAPRRPGLFVVTALGSRGIASSTLGGAIVAARIAGAPFPAEADLLDAVDPARFASRRARARRESG